MSDKIKKIKNAINNEDVEFYFLPNTRLKDLIMQNSHPIIQELPQNMKLTFLEGKGISIANDMVLKFIEGNLDKKNKLILDNGEIRVINNSDLKISVADLRVKGE
ncbi:hypothetical protein CL614_02905 [archaeon]|jgi:hypothetical protein|nr:hypothetical protein [archaeon]|tara:strand:+ start:8917 stop:9231 length:315 start_codon:yes stop_codon:yes gene_type:complete